MTELSTMISRDFNRHYEKTAHTIHALVADLSDQQLWARPYPYGNSVGHLLLHLTGNLNYYIGAQIAQNGYIRNRDLEFTDTSRKPKHEVLEAFDRAVAMVQSTLALQTATEWIAPYTAKGFEDAGDRFTVFLRCASHLQHHLAQIIYLCKEIARQDHGIKS